MHHHVGMFTFFQVLVLVGLVPLFAEESHPLIMFSIDDNIYEDLRSLALDSGRPLTSFTIPLSSKEVAGYLDELDPAVDPALQAKVRERLKGERPTFSSGAFDVRFGFEAGAEAAMRTDKEVPWVLPDTHHTAPTVAVKSDVHAFNSFEAVFSIGPVLGLNHTECVSGHGWTTFDWAPGHTELDMMPDRAYVAVGGNWWNLQVGKDRLSFGAAHCGNLLVSDSPEYLDMARLSAFSKHFKYSFVIAQIPMRDVWEHVDTSVPELNPNDSKYNNATTRITQRYLYVHRFDFKPCKSLTLSLTEELISGDGLQVRFLNPLAFMHNFNSGTDWANGGDMDNSLFSVDFQWAFHPGFDVYGQIAIDDVDMPINDSSTDPNGMAYLLGADAGRFFLEMAYADPYMYMDNSPFAASLWQDSQGHVTTWLSYPDGRDFFSVHFGARFLPLPNLKLEPALFYIIRGTHGMLFDYQSTHWAESQKLLSGTAEHQISLSCKVLWQPLSWLNLSGGLGASYVYNLGNKSGKTAFNLEPDLGFKAQVFI
jgi:hypothetical protein